MPWLSEAMKDVTGCDKFRLGAYNRMTRKFPNGETHLDEDQVLPSNREGKPGELKHLSTRRKRKQ